MCDLWTVGHELFYYFYLLLIEHSIARVLISRMHDYDISDNAWFEIESS